MNFVTTFQRQPGALIMCEALAAVAVIGSMDSVTGYEVSLSIIYAIPVFVVAWCTDRNKGVFLGVVCGIVWWWANGFAATARFGAALILWETFGRTGFFVFTAIGAASLKRERHAAANRIGLLEHSRRLEREIIDISEREQRRIGRDLHDGLCQYQAALACAATSLKSDLLKKQLAAEAGSADQLATRLRDAIAQTRDLARGLVPVQMEQMGLPSALEELADSTRRLQSIDCRFELHGEPPMLENTAATHLYRIAQEAINNATRHGSARRIIVSLETRDDSSTLRVCDNGIGLSHAPRSQSGMGLSIMNYRAKLSGGELRIEEPNDGGTIVSCLIPLAEGAHEAAA
ncbi:MAG TPA: sensor histidine kinase [Chthoniobacterales bacterium]